MELQTKNLNHCTAAKNSSKKNKLMTRHGTAIVINQNSNDLEDPKVVDSVGSEKSSSLSRYFSRSVYQVSFFLPFFLMC